MRRPSVRRPRVRRPSVRRCAGDNLVHHWNFDEGRDWHDDPFRAVVEATIAKDSVGSADLSLKNMQADDWVSGRQFSGLQFDGIDDHLVSGVDLSETLGGTSSLSFWLNTTQRGHVQAELSPGIAGQRRDDGAQWGWLDHQGHINLSVRGSLAVRSASPVNDGIWHHVVFTRDATSGLARVYVDGELSQSGNGPAGEASATFSSLGRVEGGKAGEQGRAFFAGRLDHVHVFNVPIDLNIPIGLNIPIDTDAASGPIVVETLYRNYAPKAYCGGSNIVRSATGSNALPFSTHRATMGFAYDVENQPLEVASFVQPANGTVEPNGDGSFTYTANANFVGNDSFEVLVTDGHGGC